MSISDRDDLVIIDNIPRANLWEDLKVTNKDGVIEGGQGAVAYRLSRQSREDAPLFVYCNGNSSDIPNHGDLISYKITPFGDLLQWDYPGYGGSGGEVSYRAIAEASTHVLAAIEDMKRSPQQRVIFWGYSLGSFVCSDMAKGYDIDGLIFEAGAPSAKAVEPFLAPKTLRAFIKPKLPDSLRVVDNVAALEPVEAKILMMSGAKDKILPVTLSRDFYNQLNASGHDVSYHEFNMADHFTISWQEGFEEAVNSFLSDIQE